VVAGNVAQRPDRLLSYLLRRRRQDADKDGDCATVDDVSRVLCCAGRDLHHPAENENTQATQESMIAQCEFKALCTSRHLSEGQSRAGERERTHVACLEVAACCEWWRTFVSAHAASNCSFWLESALRNCTSRCTTPSCCTTFSIGGRRSKDNSFLRVVVASSCASGSADMSLATYTGSCPAHNMSARNIS
jgi:hypothetical protein